MATLKTNQSPSETSSRPKTAFSKVPIKFKAIILKSLFDKHRNKELNSLRNAFFTWYIQKNDNQLLKDHIDRLLIAQKQSKFTASRFFYRMKLAIRRQLSSMNQNPSPQDESKHKTSNSQIREQQNCIKKNFADYFDSLKNIFSLKMIDNEGLNLGQKFEIDLKNQEKRLKTEGCEVGTSVDESFTNKNRLSEFAEKEKQMETQILDKEMKVKEIGRKVALTLIKSFIINLQRKHLLVGFVQIAKFSQIKKNYLQHQLLQSQHLKQLSLITKQSSSINIQTQPPQSSLLSQSFLQTSRSSEASLPPLTHINTQISHVQYSLNLLSQAIKKDNQLQELYREFHSQFGEFESIEKDFEVLRVKTRNSLFDRLFNLKKKLEKWLLRQAFNQLLASSDKKPPTQSGCRSKVNLQTLHQIFSKPLLPSAKLSIGQPSQRRSQMQFPLTSIKVICERTNKTETNFYKPSTRGGIKKQTLKQNAPSTTNHVNTEMGSTFGSKFKDQPTGDTQHKAQSCQSTSRNHVVNFALPKGQASLQSSQISSSICQKSQLSSGSIKDNFRKKLQNNMNSTGGFYELSMKSLHSNNSSSQSTKYHAQMKSQYWWNDLEEKENLVIREGSICSRSSVGNQQ